ncbi:MAG: hypothetical protein V3T15_09900, partial [Pseudomonadales bacterium]
TAQNAVIDDVNALSVGASNVTGDFSLTTGNVLTSDQQLTVGGVFAVDVSGTDLALTNNANDFGVLAMQARDALVVDADDLALGASALSGNLVISSGGIVTNVAPISVAGTLSLDASGTAVTLDESGNVILGAVSAANVSDLTIVNATDLLLADITLGGAINLDSAGGISQAAGTRLSIPGTSEFIAVGSIDLSGVNDLMNEVRLNTSGPLGDAFVRTSDLTLGSSVLSGALSGDAQTLTLVGDVSALSQDLSNTGPVMVAASGVVTLQSSGDVNLGTNSVDAVDANLDGLDIQSSGAVSVGVVGAANPLQSFSVTGNTITLDGNVTTGGAQSFIGPTSILAANAVFTGASVSFANTLNGTTTSVAFNADASFGGDVSVASVQANRGVIFAGGDVSTVGDQAYLGGVTLAAPDGDTVLQGDNVFFDAAILSPVAGSNALIVQATGDVSFSPQANVGVGGQALARLDVAGNSIILDAGSVETVAGQTYRNSFILGTDATLTNVGAGEVGFLDTLTGSGVENLVIAGNARLDDVVSALASLTVTGVSNFNTGNITTAGAQSYGAGVLGTDVTITASDVTFTGNVDSAAGQPGSNLDIALTGAAAFLGDIGAQERLGSLAINQDASFAGAVLTADADVSVAGTMTLVGPLVTVDTGSGPVDIILADIDAQGNDLTLSAGTGSIFLNGSAVDLNNFAINGADQVNLAAVTALGDVSVTGAVTATIDGSLVAQSLSVRVDNGYLQNADVAVADAVYIETNQGSLVMVDGTRISGNYVSLVNRDVTLDENDTAILVSQINAGNEIRVGAAQGNILVTPVPAGESNFSGNVLRIGGDTLVPASPADPVDLTSLAGDRFGTPDLPSVISVTDLVAINSRIASQPVFLIRPDVLNENSLRELSLAQTLEAVGDTQRTTVVQLVLLDPAIFTAISNVGAEEEPVRLPEAQLVD